MTEQNKYFEPINLRNARITFRNFKGEDDGYNANHARYFSLLLDDEMANDFMSRGLTVKYPKPNPNIDPSEDNRKPTLQVYLANNAEPLKPHVRLYMVDEGVVRRIDNADHAQIGNLDSMRIESVDVSIQPSAWEYKGRTGVKCYINALYVKLAPTLDPFAAEYTDNIDVPFD